MRRSTSSNAACSTGGAQTVTAKPIRFARSATATATGLDPQTTTWARGSTGSTNMSIVPWLGHMFSAKRTPPFSSPGLQPCLSNSSGGSTETRRDRPSARASLAALITAARAQPPPIQPSEIVPSAKITALAPALAAVAATVRTTVASTTGSPAAFRDEMMPRISVAFFIKSQRCKIGFQCRQAFEIVRGRKEIDIRQRCLHSARLRRVVPPADQRIEPGNLSAAPSQAPHLPSKLFGLACVVAVRDDHHSRARIDHTARVPTIESREALTDASAAADALRHHRKLVHRACDVAIAQRWRHVRKPGVEDECLRFAEGVHHAMQEADEERGIKVHRARGVEQNDEAQRLDFAAPPSEIHGRSAMRYIAMDRTPQVEPPPAPADLLAANQPRAHDARKLLGQRMGSRHVGGIGDMAEIADCQVFKARRALPPPAAIGYDSAISLFATLDMIRLAT